MGLERFFPFAIVKRVVCVEPVARPVNRQVRNLREFWCLNKELLLGDKGRNEIDFVLVQMELSAVKVPIHVGISQEDFCRAAFNNYVQHLRPAQLVEGLRRKYHRGVSLPPRLERLDDVPLNARILQKYPCLVYEKRFEYGTDLPITNDRVRAMQDVKQKRLEKFRVLAHFLKVKTLKMGKGNRVFRIIEEESELAAACPFRKPVRNAMAQRVRHNS